MPETLHIVQRAVNHQNALGALHTARVACEPCDMNLTKIRKARGLSQKALGEMIGMDAATVNRAEKMAPSAKLTTYAACAEVLGVTLEDIFGPDLTELERRIIAGFRAMPEAKRQRVAELFDLVAGPQEPSA